MTTVRGDNQADDGDKTATLRVQPTQLCAAAGCVAPRLPSDVALRVADDETAGFRFTQGDDADFVVLKAPTAASFEEGSDTVGGAPHTVLADLFDRRTYESKANGPFAVDVHLTSVPTHPVNLAVATLPAAAGAAAGAYEAIPVGGTWAYTPHATRSTWKDSTVDAVAAPGSLTLTFDASNWNVSQTVRVKGLDDVDFDGDVEYDLVLTPSSYDPNYDAAGGAFPDAVTLKLVNVDDDEAGIVFAQVGTECSEPSLGKVRLPSPPSSSSPPYRCAP